VRPRPLRGVTTTGASPGWRSALHRAAESMFPDGLHPVRQSRAGLPVLPRAAPPDRTGRWGGERPAGPGCAVRPDPCPRDDGRRCGRRLPLGAGQCCPVALRHGRGARGRHARDPRVRPRALAGPIRPSLRAARRPVRRGSCRRRDRRRHRDRPRGAAGDAGRHRLGPCRGRPRRVRPRHRTAHPAPAGRPRHRGTGTPVAPRRGAGTEVRRAPRALPAAHRRLAGRRAVLASAAEPAPVLAARGPGRHGHPGRRRPLLGAAARRRRVHAVGRDPGGRSGVRLPGRSVGRRDRHRRVGAPSRCRRQRRPRHGQPGHRRSGGGSGRCGRRPARPRGVRPDPPPGMDERCRPATPGRPVAAAPTGRDRDPRAAGHLLGDAGTGRHDAHSTWSGRAWWGRCARTRHCWCDCW
jgi:hypothetical protein